MELSKKRIAFMGIVFAGGKQNGLPYNRENKTTPFIRRPDQKKNVFLNRSINQRAKELIVLSVLSVLSIPTRCITFLYLSHKQS